MGALCLSWYALRKGDRRYRTIPVELTLGPDLARTLHSIWPIIENHADRLDRLCRQQIGEVLVVQARNNLFADEDPQRAAVRLCQTALLRGSSDKISGIVRM